MPQHRAGRLKQTNKAHKIPGGTRPSKEKAVQGRTGPALSGVAAMRATAGGHVTNSNATGAKQARLNRQKQLMFDKRVALFKQRRQQQSSVSRVVTVLPLSVDVDVQAFHAALRSISHEWTQTSAHSSPHRLTVSYQCASQRCGFVFVSDPSLFSHTVSERESTQALLETVALSDAVLLLAQCDENVQTQPLVDQMGEKLLSLLAPCGHRGLCLALVPNSHTPTSTQPPKRLNLRNPHKSLRSELERTQQVLTETLGLTDEETKDLKPLEVCDATLARGLSDVSGKGLRWRGFRSYMHADGLSFVDAQGGEAPVIASNVTAEVVESMRGKRGRVVLSGCLRGVPLYLHSILHITGVGPVRLSAVEKLPDPRRRSQAGTVCERVESDRSQQDDLTTEAVPDSLLGEQTWPEEHEMRHDGAHSDDHEKDEDMEGSDGDDDDDFFAGLETMPSQRKTVYAQTLPASQTNALGDVAKDGDDREDDDYVDVPDPEDGSARERFARYRALQSFRSSYWHPRENLPFTYGKIFQFDDFKGLQKSVLTQIEDSQRAQFEPFLEREREKKREKKRERSEAGSVSARSRSQSLSLADDAMDEDDDHEEDGEAMMEDTHAPTHASLAQRALTFESDALLVPGMSDHVRSDQLVRLVLDDVPLDLVLERVRVYGSLSLFSLHRHECKTSVLHFNIRRVPGFTERVKSKTPLLFYNGFRFFLTKPIFSESNLNCDKHKFCRSLPLDGFSVASCVGPVCMTPNSPLLVFRASPVYAGQWELIATGQALSVDPDRIMLKKIVIFGNPIRVRKRTAVIKHMFYDPADVKWFRPAELVTLQGLRGHIRESVGTHGLFKALFSGPIKQNDQVLLVLYKRVFPKIPTLPELLAYGLVSEREAQALVERARDVPSVDFSDAEKSSVVVK